MLYKFIKMIKWHVSLFASLGITSKSKPEEKSTPVVITEYSQPHVLQQRMNEEKLKHGDRVVANLFPVRLESNFGKMVMYFCPMQDIEVTELMELGDGGSLPPEATLLDVNVPANMKPGLYNMKKVQLFSNGTLQVIATTDTEFEPA